MSSEEIYKGVILDHARHPRNRGNLEDPDLKAEWKATCNQAAEEKAERMTNFFKYT